MSSPPVTKHEWDYRNSASRIEKLLKSRPYVILAFRFVIEHIIKGSPVCDATTRLTEDLAAEPTVHATAIVVKTSVQALVVLRTMMWLHDPLRPRR